MKDYKVLEETAQRIRRDIVTMLHASKSGHPGGSLSASDILTALYFETMNVDPEHPNAEDRDRFILSKGHAAPVLYATLAEKGYFPKEELMTLRKEGAMLQGHPDMKGIPGVDMSTGSLGQGLAAANGMALAAKLDNKDYNVYALLGDGEVQEGMVWEAAMFAAHYKLDNVTIIIDHNGLQIDGKNEDVMGVEPLNKKWEAFGWHVIMIDGHNFEEIISAIEKSHQIKDKPTAIIAKTVKGKGVSFMENEAGWHGKAPNDVELKQALTELGGGQ